MWQKIKRGFAYGFGGALGWRLGQWFADLLSRLFAWLVLLIGAASTVFWPHWFP